MSKKDNNQPVDPDTTGHSWDGIEEFNNPLPKWWLWTFYATIVWGIGYTIAYPAWPLIEKATPGLLKYSTRGEVVEEIAAVEAANEDLNVQLASADLTTLPENAELHRYAVNGGRSLFAANCSQCHGSGAAGFIGYPNLLDDDWLWGGDIDTIAYTINHGIRNDQSPDSHWSEMPAFGEILEPEEIQTVVSYVQSISGQEHDADLAAAGEEIFLDQCSACHLETGMGEMSLGAPNLTDAIWLYGGDPEALTETITYSRFGVMPAWGLRLSEAEVNALAAYVHQLGGGQ
ncbi:MAG: cytochrome-c oxidase, cbb3-type subunit III [Pseudomonadota bacterium]